MKMKSKMEQDRVAHEIETYYITDGCYASNWGATDLYDDAEKNLRELLAKNGEFRTAWCDSKKELESFRLWFSDERIIIEVSKWMDDLYEQPDLIYDALDCIGAYDVELDDEEIKYLQDMLFMTNIDDETQFPEEVSRDISYEDLMDKINEMLFEADEFLNSQFEAVKSMVGYYLENERKAEGEQE